MLDICFIESLRSQKDAAGVIAAVQTAAGGSSMLDLSDSGGKDPMDTFGNLIDKLITVDLKMWHNQEDLYAIRRMTPEQFEAKYGADMKGLHRIIDRCCTLNVQRAGLMDEVDKFLSEAIAKGKGSADLVREQCKMY